MNIFVILFAITFFVIIFQLKSERNRFKREAELEKEECIANLLNLII